MRYDKLFMLCTLMPVLFSTGKSPVFGQSKQEIATQIEAYRKRITDIDFFYTFEAENIVSDPARGNARFIPKMNIHIMYKGDKQFIAYEAWNDIDAKEPTVDIRVYNGKYSRNHNPRRRSGSVTPGRDRFVGKHNYVYEALLWPTEEIEHEVIRLTRDLLALIQHERTEVADTSELVHGAESVLFSFADGSIKAWVDTEHGCIPRRVEIRSGSAAGPLVTRYEIPKLHEVNGIHFPAVAVKELFAGPSNPKEMWNTVVARFTMTVPREKLKINPGLTDKDFDYEFPPGTTVHDTVSGSTYTTEN